MIFFAHHTSEHIIEMNLLIVLVILSAGVILAVVSWRNNK